MAECTCTVGEMNAMLIGVFLNKIVVCFFGCLLLLFGFFWVVVMVWAAIAHGYCSPLVSDGNLNAQRYHDDILAHHVIPLFLNNANISIFQHDNATSHTARDTVDFLRTK